MRAIIIRDGKILKMRKITRVKLVKKIYSEKLKEFFFLEKEFKEANLA